MKNKTRIEQPKKTMQEERSRTKLGLFCESIIEACIIIALVVSPLLINRYGENGYDMPKGTLVRSIAVIILLAFIINRMENKSSKEESPASKSSVSRQPIFIAVLLMLASYIISTVFSVTPHTSWWGHLGARFQGAYTILAYIIIFIIMTLTIRRKEQIERIINGIIITSIPVCIYGSYQLLQFSPIWSVRIDATLGNPIFFGSYLVMVIPLTLLRFIQSFNYEQKYRLFFIICYGFLILFQGFCLIFTQSRGPLVGLGVGLGIFLILWFIIKHQRKLTLALYGIALFGLIVLIIFNIPGGPLEQLKKVPYVGRLGQIFETEGGPGKVRLLIWEGMLNMVKAEPSRAAIGYGPEMMKVLYYKHSPNELVTFERRVAFPDRAHSDFYDILATNGFIGVIIYLAIIFLILFSLLKYTALIKNTKQRNIFIGITGISVLTGIFLPYLITHSLIYIGLGITFGLIASGIVYILIYLVSWEEKKENETQTANQTVSPDISLNLNSRLTLIAIGSALIAHFAELEFGINVNSSAFYGWLFLGLFTAYVSYSGEANETATDAKLIQPNIFFYSFTVITALIVLIFTMVNFIHPYSDKIPRTADTLLDSFIHSFNTRLLDSPDKWLLLLYALFTVGLGIFLSMLLKQGESKKSLGWILQWYFIIIVSTTALFLISHSFFIYLQSGIINAIINLYIWLFIIMFLLALSIYHPESGARFLGISGLIGSLVLVIIGISIIWFMDINLIRSNNVANSARVFRDAGAEHWNEAIRRYEEAKRLTPDPTFIYADLSETYRLMAEAEKDVSKRSGYINKSLENALESAKYEPSSWYRNANLARLYRFRLAFTQEPKERHSYITEAENYYKISLDLCPTNPQLFNEVGEFYNEIQDYNKAISYYEQSLKIDRHFSETLAHLGDVYLTMGNKETATKYYKEAVEEYQTSDLFFLNPNQDILYVRSHQQAIALDTGYYLGYYGLARYQGKQGKVDTAITLARNALLLAPAEKKLEIERFIEYLTPKQNGK